MTTLRDLWKAKGMTSTRLAGQVGISVPTLYKMNRKEQVSMRTIDDVCRVLGITRDQYDALEACSQADRWSGEKGVS